jgi:hypothetical protein
VTLTIPKRALITAKSVWGRVRMKKGTGRRGRATEHRARNKNHIIAIK